MSIENIGDLVLYKNNQVIAFNKPAAIGVQADKTQDTALTNLAEIYCKHPVFTIHRIDRPATGVVLFAKNQKALANINAQFQNQQVTKTYLAVVKNKPEEMAATLTHYLRKNQEKNRSKAFDKPVAHAKKSELTYELIKSIDNYHLLQIQLHSGRHHQIRAQLAAINCPIKGDVKYGFKRSNKDRSIHLHAWKLAFKHPTLNEKVELVAPVPQDVVWQAFEL